MFLPRNTSTAISVKDTIEAVLKEKKIPASPWDLSLIENMLFSLSLMDSNNFENKASIGEREGRCFSNIVAKRHHYFTHGIGRSGELTEAQPKAAGSSILYKLTNLLLEDFMSLGGFNNLRCLLVPLSTEMTIMLCLLTFHSKRKEARYVLCFGTDKETENVITNAGFHCIPFNTDTLENEISKVGIKCVNCLFISASNPKTIEKLLVLNVKYELSTVFYNICSPDSIDVYKDMGGIDLIIYEDRLSIFPMDTTIVCSYEAKVIEQFSRTYPGRATISSTIDTFTALLSLGRINITELLKVKIGGKDDTSRAIDDVPDIPHFSHGAMRKDYFSGLIPKLFVDKGFDALRARNNALEDLLVHGKIPDVGWSDMSIEFLLQQLSSGSGRGVSKRHFNFVNGIDLFKSYDIHNLQNSKETVLNNLTNSLLRDLLKIMGIQEKVECTILPVATGMSLVLSMLACRKLKPESKYVIWSRIDQKSCFKSIVTAGFIPIIIDMKKNGDRTEFVTDTETMENKIKEVDPKNVVCVISVTSCFAPRACDNIEAISELCKKYDVFHIVNNAYGLTSRRLMNRIHRGKLKGNLDLFVQSTDKNFLVPVGGAVVASFNPRLFDALKLTCTGTVSVSSTLDVFITLMSMGKEGFQKLVRQREDLHQYLWEKLDDVASRHGEEIADNSGNPISIALTLKSLKSKDLTSLGSSLFLKNVFGAKVVTSEDVKDICGYKFVGWGSHSHECNFPYIACAAAFGVTQRDVDIFVAKLDSQMAVLKNKKS